MSSSQWSQSARKQGKPSSTNQAEASTYTTLANISLAKESYKGRVQSQGAGMYNLPPASEAIKLVYRNFPCPVAKTQTAQCRHPRVQSLFRELDLICHN